MILEIRLMGRELRKLHTVLESTRSQGDPDKQSKARLVVRVRILEAALTEMSRVMGMTNTIKAKIAPPPIVKPVIKEEVKVEPVKTKTTRPKKSKISVRETQDANS